MSRCYLLMDTYTHVYPDLYTHIWKSCKICLLFIIPQPEWAKKRAYFGRGAWIVLRSSHACLNLPSDTASGSCQHTPHCLRSHYTVSHFCWDVLWLHADDLWNCASFSLIAELTMKSIWLANCITIQILCISSYLAFLKQYLQHFGLLAWKMSCIAINQHTSNIKSGSNLTVI